MAKNPRLGLVGAWTALAIFALWPTIDGTIEYLGSDRAVAYYWPRLWVWTAPAALFLAAGTLAALEARRNPIVAVLAASLFLDTSVNFIAQGQLFESSLSDVASNLGLFGIILSVALFPNGRIGHYGRWVLPSVALILALEVITATVWKPWGMPGEWQQFGYWALPVCLALVVPALFAKWRLTADSAERGQIDWMMSGVLLWGSSLLAAQFVTGLAALLEMEWSEDKVGFVTECFMSLAFSAFAACVIVSVAARNATVGPMILKMSASASLILLGLVVAVGLVQILFDQFIAQAFGQDSGLKAKAISALIAACFIRPAHERAKKLIEKWSSPPEPAEAASQQATTTG